MTQLWEKTLASAVELLRELPRRRGGVAEARSAVAEWAASLPECAPQLVVDTRPGSPVVDYDLLLEHPRGGTVALATQADDGVPWGIDHSTHWAAHLVVTVNGYDLSYPRALDALRTLGGRYPDIRDRLVDHCLLMEMVGTEEEAPTSAELQAAADDFRRVFGLHSREATLAWLEENGLGMPGFEANVETAARLARVRRRLESRLGPGYLKDRRADFDQVSAVWVESPDEQALERLRKDAEAAGDLAACLPGLLDGFPRDVSVRALTGMAMELPEPLRDLPTGAITGPVGHGGSLLLGQLRRRRSGGTDDPDAVAAAGRMAFREWLARQRSAAKIDWHWQA
ncbi:TIGR04500 family putative peptide maturation system protein [Planomonospora sp. ID67723]|uniref:TIGR04500 family putative peptide maturation system protein n=1 Tax=Planomonospora sp. ID67723 TaxID=2738134 RepID=UPI0018C415DB|nr:TIGR04500 family putative peptide maturation system protein [Planomonospora sp. ID67723]MBG0826870.1 TIGR04500 family putative peptide maturation system protein [Planomonospora sp. ID67723]